MLRQNNFDLNSMHLYADSLKEGLKKTMLDQETMFRTQVQELHRLYRIQKMLMENIDLYRFDRNTLGKARTQSTWLFHSSNPAGHKPSVSLAEDTKFSSTAMVGSTHSKSLEFSDRHRNVCYSMHQKPLDFQLPSHQLTSYVDQRALNLSLSIGEEDRRMACATSTCFDQKNSSCTQNITDLDEPTEGISNKEENHVACSTFAAVTKCHSQISVLSEQIITSNAKINISRDMEESNCPFRNRESYPEESSAGFQTCHEALVNKSSSIKNKQCNEVGKLDLNQVQLDDSSCYTSDHKVASHSTASSLQIFGIHLDRTLEIICPSKTLRKKSSKCLFDVSDAIDSVPTNSNSKSDLTDPKCNEIKGSEAGLTGSKAVSRTQIGLCKDFGYCMSDPENKNVGSISELSDDQSTYPDGTNVATRTVKHDSSRDNEISCAFPSPTDGDGNIVPALRESSSTVDKSSAIKTRQPQTNLGNTNHITTDQHLGADGGNQLVHDCPKEVEAPKMAMCIQTAAQLLMNFSLGSSSGNQDCSSKAESIEVDKKMEKPQCSDSYELIALKLEECNADDCCVSSKPCEIEGTEKKDFGFKLKRGRRFKDFQREILPGLASLSRDEIQEDINILEAVLRSREYWKIRATMASQRSWCTPVRNRRSKRKYVRRRIF